MVRSARRQTPDTDLTQEHIVELIKQTEGVCGITGVQLDLRPGALSGPYAPSLDQIDVEGGGHVKGNV